MLITIRPHSSFKQFFIEKEYKADFSTYNDLLFYLNGMHKRFVNYLRLQKAQGIEESFVILDKNLRIINPDELQLKRAKEGDILHIVPAIVGGGGKRGGILAVLAIAAFAFVALPAIGVGAAASSAGAGLGSSVAAGIKSSSLLSNLVINIGLALLTSLFATKPSEENARQSDMFGSLVNSTSSGTPVALTYGMMRVAGQMINGYVLSLSHGKTQNMNVYGEVFTSASTSRVDQERTRSEFLSGFNSFT